MRASVGLWVVLLMGCAPTRGPEVVFSAPAPGARLESGTLLLSGRVQRGAVGIVRCSLDGAPGADLRVGVFGEFGALVNASGGAHVIACHAGGRVSHLGFEVDAFVRSSGTELTVNGQPFRFVGVNAYYLHEEATRELQGTTASEGRLDEVLARAAELGATVVRTWGFNDDPESGTVIQEAPLIYSETGLQGLDRVIAAAGAHGIRLVLPLGNYWSDYGGVAQYLRWHHLPESRPARFFTDPEIRAHFRRHIETLLTRRNTITGLEYRDDPTILAWELLNEPRGTGLDPEGRALAAWVSEMAGTIHRVDPNHLVGTGEEGFDSVGSLDTAYWRRVGGRELVSVGNGSDFFANTAAVDFASVHVYPEAWGIGRGRTAEAGARWIDEHAAIAESLGRPLIVGEFGLRNRELAGGTFLAPERRAIYDQWLGTAGESPRVSGVLSWVLMHDGRTDTFDAYAWTWASGHPVEFPGMQYAELYRQYAALLSGGFL